MAQRISLEPHLTIEELEGRYRSTKDPEQSGATRYHFRRHDGMPRQMDVKDERE
jgi:hypothetical protein